MKRKKYFVTFAVVTAKRNFPSCNLNDQSIV